MDEDRALRVRDVHRKWLGAHLAALLLGLGGAFVANRFLSPGTFWAGWAALGWGLAFLAHFVVFARVTLGTLGRGS